ncbi:response regulator [Candidatus Magnetaquicoccus inordinatus]|uniref:response regulator n=1 Tax=Candidatus Magnetaquicoccus inordinatus TaxID=2496818 RepID=UPI00187D2BA6|nr:response regulator [Candidatus Magnetaquicoccus inordinatus]MBF0184935.1 response regulator [Magnetococcales bacterium]
MKILIADDELHNRKLLRDYLKSFGQCDMTSDGKAALELFVTDLEDGEPYDIVFLDIIMPVMDGQKTLGRMRAAEKRVQPTAKEIPIIMVTGMDSSLQAMEAYFKGGCSDYLTKPVTRQLLLEKMRKLKLIPDEEG